MAANPRYRFLYVVWAFLECMLFGGLLYGWGSLVFVLKEDGVYSEVCDVDSDPQSSTGSNFTTILGSSSVLPAVNNVPRTNTSGNRNTADEEEQVTRQNLNCPDRDKLLTLVFTIGSMMFCVGSAVMGQINFKFGTRATRLSALGCFTLGGILTAFTSHEVPWLIFPGLSLLGMGGIPILMTNAQFSMLFTKGSSTVVSIISGAFDASSGVILIVKLLHERGVALRWSMIVITCSYFITLVSTFFFLPRDFISKPVPPVNAEDAVVTNEAGVELIGKTNSRSVNSEKDSEETPKAKTKAEEKEALQSTEERREQPSIKSLVLSPVYILHVVWLSVLQLRFYYFLGSLNTWLNSMFSEKKDVSYYTNICMYAMMCGLFTSPVAGAIFDIFKRIFCYSRSQLRRDLMPAVIPLAMTSLFGILLSVLVLFDQPSILYPAFILNTLFRSFIYSMGAAYIGVMFPSEYFGVLYGLMIVLSGVISMAQYGLFSWAEATGFTSVNYFLIAFMATSLVHPAYQWYVCRRAESQVTMAE